VPSTYARGMSEELVDQMWLRFTASMATAMGAATLAVATATYFMGVKDDSSATAALVVAGIITVLMPLIPFQQLRQLRAQGVKAPFMGADGIADEEFASIAGPGAEGTLMTFGPDARKRAEAKDIVAKFRAKNFEPQAYTLYSYAAVQVIKQAAEAAKSLDPKKVAAQIKSGQKFNTVIGQLSYDKKGDVTRIDYTVYVWKKDPSGKITYTEIQ